MAEFVEKHFKNDIRNNVVDWVFSNIGKTFMFREHQLDTIVDILYNILNDVNHNQIIEAPTGSGKSLINMISAGVLADVYDRQSYILCTDLYLWEQYNNFINTHSIIKKKFGVLKGQTGNYTCAVNNEDMRNADCRMAGISWGSLFNLNSAQELGYTCAFRCKYIRERKKALRSKVVLMTYALYHYMVNIVAKTMPAHYAFGNKDIIFCDECHNIPNIVSNNFSPTVTEKHLECLEKLRSWIDKTNNAKLDLFHESEDDIDFGIAAEYTKKSLEKEFYKIFDVMKNEHSSNIDNVEAAKQYKQLLMEFLPVVTDCESKMSYKKQISKKDFSKEDREFYKATSWYKNMCCLWSDFTMAIEETGPDYIIKNLSEDRKDKHITVEYKCVKEDYICYKYLLNTAIHRVMTSATIGGIDAFEENVGIKYTEDAESEYVRVPSIFNFDKSPVHFLNRYKMSYANKPTSFPRLQNIIYKICESNFPKERGMIQTGSYANAKELYNNAPPKIKSRMLLYNDAKEKTEMITMHQMSSDTILIGPTLIEGVDLPNDQCRFIIILKVPYPVIVDKYVKKKIELFPLWYNATTSNTIIQGIGRGVRNEQDYCTTYILDACFLTLYNATKDQYPTELQERIKIYA